MKVITKPLVLLGLFACVAIPVSWIAASESAHLPAAVTLWTQWLLIVALFGVAVAICLFVKASRLERSLKRL